MPGIIEDIVQADIVMRVGYVVGVEDLDELRGSHIDDWYLNVKPSSKMLQSNNQM